jgi:hypothetical protein
MSPLTKIDLKRKRRITGLLGFVHISINFIAGFMLGYPYISLMDYVSGTPDPINTLFVMGGLGIYLAGLAIATLSFYLDRKPFDVEHPVRRRHNSIPRFLLWLFLWNLILIFIIGFFARYYLIGSYLWIGTINDFVVRYVLMLGSILMIMGFLLMWGYNRLIPDRSLLSRTQFRRKLIYVGVYWAIIVVIFTFGVFVGIPTIVV